MKGNELEEQLAALALPEPPGQLRPQLLARARREVRWQRVERAWRWSLAFAAAVVVAVNLCVVPVQEQRLVALLGPPQLEQPLNPTILVERLEHQQHVLLALLTPDYENQLKEDSL